MYEGLYIECLDKDIVPFQIDRQIVQMRKYRDIFFERHCFEKFIVHERKTVVEDTVFWGNGFISDEYISHFRRINPSHESEKGRFSAS